MLQTSSNKKPKKSENQRIKKNRLAYLLDNLNNLDLLDNLSKVSHKHIFTSKNKIKHFHIG